MILTVDEALQLAMEEALKGAPFVSPNPKVGCVILNSKGELLSKGYHTRHGQPHAEVEALRGLTQDQLQGAHVIVTLEPCAHEGKTPSCAKALAKLPIAKVTFGLVDPNPLVAGQGAKIIRTAGIQCEEYQGPLKNKLEEICEEFLWNFREKKVFVALKVAQSLDGKIALSNGISQWITGPEAREKVHELRAQYDAVLVGKNTVLKDNPSLNIRHPNITKQNRVIIMDRKGELLKHASSLKLFQLHKPENIFLCVSKEQSVKTDLAHVIHANSLHETLNQIYSLGIRSVMVEGGGQVFSQFILEGLVQRYHVFTAPIILGRGLDWTDGIAITSMDKRSNLKPSDLRKFGDDIYFSARA